MVPPAPESTRNAKSGCDPVCGGLLNRDPVKRSPVYRWELLTWLWLAFFLNQADRAIFGVVLSPIQNELGLTDAQAGLVASVLFWTLAVLVPFTGYAGDVFSKRRIITGCVAFWSFATMATGWSRGVASLVLFRSIATGGGEAFYAPAANALISQYHRLTRSIALSVHQTGLYAGLILSGFLGGWIADRWGWRSTFYVFGGAGILLAFVLLFRLHDAPEAKETADRADGTKRPSFIRAVRAVFGCPTALLVTVAFTAVVFVNNGYVIWAPTFLKEKFDMNLAEAGGFSMLYHHVWALVGVMIGGPVTDLLVRVRRGFRLGMQGSCLLLGAPFIVLMGLGEQQTTIYIGMSGFGLFRGLFEANTYASLYDVIEPRLRSSASGIMIFFAFMAGAFAPWVLGAMKSTLGLNVGLASLSAVYVVGGLAVLIALFRYFQKDYYDETRS